MPADDPGEAVEDLLHDVVVESLPVEVLLPGRLPVSLRVELDLGEGPLVDVPVLVWRGRTVEEGREDVVT